MTSAKATSRYTKRQLIFGGLGLLVGILLTLEAISLFVLWVILDRNRLNEHGTFFLDHLLTRPFAKELFPGKRYIGNLKAGTPNWREILVPDSLLGWRMAPNVAAIHNNRYLYITDPNGFIADIDDPPVTVRKTEGTYRIIVIGGSTVMGQGAPRPSDNLVGKLRQTAKDLQLTGPNETTVEFINGSVGGYHSGQEYLHLFNDLLRYSPDLVIVYDGWNDSEYHNILLKQHNDASPLLTETHFEMTRRINRSFGVGGAASNLLSAMGNSISDLKTTVGLIEIPYRAINWMSTKGGKSENSRPPPMQYDKRSVAFYEQNLRADLSLAKANGMRMALFLQPLSGVDGKIPSAEEKASAWYPLVASHEISYREPFYRDARKMFVQLGGEYPSPQFCVKDISRVFEGVGDTVYADTGHLVTAGNTIVAKQMLADLLVCGQLMQAKKSQ